jgi:ketopantoate reductase
MEQNEILQIAISSVTGLRISKEEADKVLLTMDHLNQENYSVTIKELNHLKK